MDPTKYTETYIQMIHSFCNFDFFQMSHVEI